jgi:hypothetical protein
VALRSSSNDVKLSMHAADSSAKAYADTRFVG